MSNNEYARGNYIYSGDGKSHGTPVREIKTISDKEAKYWDYLDKKIREASKKRF